MISHRVSASQRRNNSLELTFDASKSTAFPEQWVGLTEVLGLQAKGG